MGEKKNVSCNLKFLIYSLLNDTVSNPFNFFTYLLTFDLFSASLIKSQFENLSRLT